MYSLKGFSVSDMTDCGRKLRAAGAAGGSLEEAARGITRFFYENFKDEKGAEAFALARFFITLPCGQLPPGLQEVARGAAEGVRPATICLTLLATRGRRKEWNSRFSSAGHKAIPLISVEFVRELPMVAALMTRFGLKINEMLKPDPSSLLYTESSIYNLFHVPRALGSPLVPHQEDFVRPEKVSSVVGFGGPLFSGSMFVIIIFSKVALNRETANMLRPLALNIKAALLPLERKVFVSPGGNGG